MKKILFIIDSLGPRGKERQLVETLKGLDKTRDYKLKVLMFNDVIHYKEVHDLDCEIEVIKRKRKKDFSIFYNMYKIINDFKPDIVHSWERMSTVYALPGAKLSRAKFIDGSIQNATPHPKKFRKRWFFEKISFLFSDVVVSNTKAGLKAYNVPKRKGHYLYNGYDFSRVSGIADPQSIREKFNLKTPHIVGMIGTFDARKDYFTFIEGAVEILKKRDDVTFVTVGDGANLRNDSSRSTFEKSKEMVPQEFREKIIFMGVQSNVESIINVFTVGVLLTNLKVHGEGISNSILEYMALSKPVIATDGGGTPEIIEDGINGFLVKNQDRQDFIQKLDILLDDPQKAAAIGQKGNEIVRAKFDLKLMTDRFVDLYERI